MDSDSVGWMWLINWHFKYDYVKNFLLTSLYLCSSQSDYSLAAFDFRQLNHWSQGFKSWFTKLWVSHSCFMLFQKWRPLLDTCLHCQRHQKLIQWPWCYCAWLVSKLAWSEPHRESMGYCQEWNDRHQTQPGCYQSNLGLHYTWAEPQAAPHWCCKEAQPSIRSKYTFQKYDISVYNILFFFF